MTLNRRSLLAGAAAFLPRGIGQAAERPNIVFMIADDQSWLHTSSAGDPVVKTPAIDRLAAEGVRFTHAFCCSPSCTPSRGSILTGQDIWRLREGGNLWSSLPAAIPVFPDLLEDAGYRVGLTAKGWGPGDHAAGGRKRNPAGPAFPSFEAFLAGGDRRQPFCFWHGSSFPHRPFQEGSGAAAGLRLDDVRVPAWLPDSREVRSDILDYLAAVQRFDAQVGAVVKALDQAGQAENTLLIVTSDNGMPFPRAKTNLYDSGTRMPLAIRWPARVRSGRVSDALVGFTDLAPTILDAAGVSIPAAMTGRSLLGPLNSGEWGRAGRQAVFFGRERHTDMRAGRAGYPARAIRTREFLYIRNFAPDRWPAGDPPHYGDIDNGRSKEFVIANREQPEFARFFEMACAKRPAEELYDLRSDPDQLTNVAENKRYRGARQRLAATLEARLRHTGDPRATGGEIIWDRSPYYGQSNAVKRPI